MVFSRSARAIFYFASRSSSTWPSLRKPGRAIAALEREMLDEGLLQRGQFAVLGVALDRADGLAVEAHRRDDAGRAGVAGPVGIVDDHRAAQALRGAAAEFRAGHAQILAQEIVHRQFVAHLDRAVGAAVDRQAQSSSRKHSLEHSSVTGSDWKRWPVASKIAFSSAATTGIMTTSAMPFGGSSGVDRRQQLDLEIVQRQIRAARDDIVAEVPLPVAGAVSNGGRIPAARSRRPSRSRLAPVRARAPEPAPGRNRGRCMPWRCAARRSRARSRCGRACRKAM